MLENQKVFIKNLTNHNVGFRCVNFPVHYSLNPGQSLPVKWEHIEDTVYDKGFRYMLDNGILKIDPKTENYDKVMEELGLAEVKKQIESSLSYDEIKKMLSVTPLAINYGVIKKKLEEGSENFKKSVASAAIELNIRDYTLNGIIKKNTGIDVIKTLELNSTSEKEE